MVMVAEQIGDDLNCVVLPMGQSGLLVPSVCVAEILPWRRIRDIDGTPDWFLGVMNWRGGSIPVLRFENLNGATEKPSNECECVAVMNRSQSTQGLAFYALATDGLPRMMQVGEQDVSSDQAEQTELGAAAAAAVTLGREHLLIPRLDYVEGQLERLRSKS